jgi:hypothetical protein
MWSNYLTPYIEIITTLVYLIPFIMVCLRKKTFRTFTYHKLTVAFNWTLLYFVILSILFMIAMKTIDVNLYQQGKGNDSTELCLFLFTFFKVL